MSTSFSYTFSLNTPSYNLAKGEKIVFKLQCNSADTSNFTASLGSNSSLLVSSLAASTGYSSVTTGSTGFFDSSSMANTGSNTTDIVLSSRLSGFWDNNYIFVPNPLTGSQNTLYSGSVNYGDVDYEFKSNLPCYDVVLIYLSDNTFIESRIINEYKDNNGLVHLTLNTPLSNSLRLALANQTYTRFLLLSRRPDETNTILSFIKRDGKTSYGFLIPENISPDVLANIDTITKEVKQKLINNQSIST